MEGCWAANVAQPEPALRCELSGVVCWWMGTMVWFLVHHFRVVGARQWWATAIVRQATRYDGRQCPPNSSPNSPNLREGRRPTHGEWKRVIFQQISLILHPCHPIWIGGNPAMSKWKPVAVLLTVWAKSSNHTTQDPTSHIYIHPPRPLSPEWDFCPDFTMFFGPPQSGHIVNIMVWGLEDNPQPPLPC